MREDQKEKRRRSFIVSRSNICLILTVLVEGLLPTTGSGAIPLERDFDPRLRRGGDGRRVPSCSRGR